MNRSQAFLIGVSVGLVLAYGVWLWSGLPVSGC